MALRLQAFFLLRLRLQHNMIITFHFLFFEKKKLRTNIKMTNYEICKNLSVRLITNICVNQMNAQKLNITKKIHYERVIKTRKANHYKNLLLSHQYNLKSLWKTINK